MKAPTTHLILKEMRVLNARMTQMAGQTISPNQKILDSDSDACCFPEVYKQDNSRMFSGQGRSPIKSEQDHGNLTFLDSNTH